MAILFRRSNGIYYHVTYLNGRRTWKSTGARRRVDAEKHIRDAFMQEQSPMEQKPSAPRFSEFIVEWHVYADTSFAPSTIRLYHESIRSFLRHIGDLPLNAYSPQHMEKFKGLRLKEVSPAKTNIEFANIKAMLNVAVKWGKIEKNPCTGVKLVKIPPQRPAYLSKEDFSRLMDSIKAPWFREIVAFAVSTMMRAGEIVNLSWGSIDLQKRVILVENSDGFRLKTTQPRAIPMNDWVYELLSKKTERSGYVFTLPNGRKATVDCLSGRFKKACRAIGLSEKIHLHSLRHTGASWLVQDGAPIFAVQRILGHSSIDVTMRYAHLVSSELHNVVNKISITF